MTVTTTEQTTLDPTPDPAVDPSTPADAPVADALVESDLLVEDVSIDGMCGVY